MLLKQFAVLASFYLLCSALCESCSVDTNYDYFMKCTSLKQLKDAGYHPEWDNLTLANLDQTNQILPNDVFKNFPNLKTLNIKGNITKIEQFAFHGLDKLENLDIENSDIDTLPYISNLVELTQIQIFSTQVKEIPANYFIKLKKLTSVNICNNLISQIGNCAFCGLNITYMSLYNNSIKSFEPHRLLGRTSFITDINLASNELTTIHRFGNMPNLQSLTYSNNSINKIEYHSFDGCPNLWYLDVANNSLQEFRATIFPKKFETDVNFMSMIHNNNIRCLTRDIGVRLKHLHFITIDDNPWKCECLQEMISWGKSAIQCFNPVNCVIPCTDAENNEKSIPLLYGN